MNNLTEIITILGGVLGTAGLWKFAESRMKLRAEQKKEEIENSDGHQYRDDLKKRVTKMEELLAESAKEKDELRSSVLKLTEEVAMLRTKVEFLEKENERLKMK
jgi:predicted nuclease with TOPRIM domain|tara:strand:- start:4258 stop:4569 length:312 start_codon:yes stop_codon:yes gene_type:complete